jgi:hypothetical protein
MKSHKTKQKFDIAIFAMVNGKCSQPVSASLGWFRLPRAFVIGVLFVCAPQV